MIPNPNLFKYQLFTFFMGRVSRYLFVFVICASLLLSVLLSLKSFTGYLVSDQINGQVNMWAFVLLITGLLGGWIYIAKFRQQKSITI